MRVAGWGRYPWHEAEMARPAWEADARRMVVTGGSMIARGLGRSYGDSSLADSILSTRRMDRLISFDSSTGVLSCEAGVSLEEVLNRFLPLGWFLPVTPGTRFITIGGAVASDVHGKNHHVAGSFSDHVQSMEVMVASGDVLHASRDTNADLFFATCGGMGLTGVILVVTFRMMRVWSSRIIETTLKAPSLDAALDAFTSNARATYSVAWIDCLATGADLGRSLVYLGEHAETGGFQVAQRRPLRLPFDFPSAAMSSFAVRAFNSLYYARGPRFRRVRDVPLEPFFYPLDSLAEWNRMYGARGFLQYQFVLPLSGGREGLREILDRIAQSKVGSFLAVLKVFGPGNACMLSFPSNGYTLALDFQRSDYSLRLLDDLDSMVLALGGRVYLAKDARMSKTTFRAGYPNWESFDRVREKYGAKGKFLSAQAMRLGFT